MPPISRLEHIGQLAIDYKVAVDRYCENAGEGTFSLLGDWAPTNPELDKKLENDMSAAADSLEKQIILYLTNVPKI
jgi:hypothetical protein